MNTAGAIFGYEFKDASLLEEALTTPSCKMGDPGVKDNQRLEFLGDAVLGFVAADRLYRSDRNMDEGDLTIRRTHAVSAPSLCAAAAKTDLAQRLKRNKGAAPLNGNSKTVADAVEAVIGAAWLDGGLDAARTMFAFLGLDADLEDSDWSANPKGELQVLTQSLVPPVLPQYSVVSVAGKPHEPVITVEVSVEGAGSARGQAGSRKEAEAKAAAKMLEGLKARERAAENG
ncbi:MAG: ribonuclease III [Kiritimatiellae bacterium]|nr:ribonuclease III [Kiritimatiellia bacterium]